MKPTKALSIKQPWAWLICAGYKDIENRDWFIGRKPALGGRFQDRGLELPKRIYVHAGKSDDDVNPVIFDWILQKLPKSALAGDLTTNDRSAMRVFNQFENNLFDYGAIIGEVGITGCVDKSDSPWFVGKYGFTLANPVLYKEPIPYRGQLGFFEVKL